MVECLWGKSESVVNCGSLSSGWLKWLQLTQTVDSVNKWGLYSFVVV